MKKQKISDYVKNDVKRSGLNQTTYCKLRGISRTLLFEIAKGKHDSPSPTTAARMCEWFHLQPEKLFEMIDDANDTFRKAVILRTKKDPKIEMLKCKTALKKFCSFFDENSIDYEGYYSKDEELNYLSDLCITSKTQAKKADGVCKINTISLKEVCDYWDDDGNSINHYTPDMDSIISDELCLYYISSVDDIYNYKTFFKPFISLLSKENAEKNRYSNNIFITRSKEQYNNLLQIFENIKITPTNNLNIGIGIVYFNDIYDLEYTPIIYNDTINDDFLNIH